MTLSERINNMNFSEMIIEDLEKPTFIIKEKEIISISPIVETRYLCFLMQKNNITIPFFYFMVRFAESPYFTYEVLSYIRNYNDIDNIKKLLTYKRLIFCFTKGNININNNKISFDNIIIAPSLDVVNINTIMDRFFKKYNESKNKSTEKDFHNYIPLFWNFIGSRIDAWELVYNINLKYGPIITMDVV